MERAPKGEARGRGFTRSQYIHFYLILPLFGLLGVLSFCFVFFYFQGMFSVQGYLSLSVHPLALVPLLPFYHVIFFIGLHDCVYLFLSLSLCVCLFVFFVNI